MKPTLFQFGSTAIPSYLTMMMIGFFAAIYLARRRGEAVGMDGVAIVDLGIFMLILGVLGARLLAVLTDGYLQDFIHLCTNPKLVDPVDTAVRFCEQHKDCGFDYLCNLDAREAVTGGLQRSMCYPPRDCLAVFKFWQGGLTFYGGILLAVPGGLWFAKRRGLGALRTADVCAPSIMLGLAFGRIGCFLNGCCYGAVTKSSFGVHFPGLPSPRHPTQLYESAAAFVLFLLLRYVVERRTRGEGELFGWMLALYGVFRMGIEVVRDDPRGGLGPMSTSQVISIPLIVVGVVLIARSRRSKAGAG